MKHLFKTSLLYLVYLLTINTSNAITPSDTSKVSKAFKYNISGTFGILNPKMRFQVELPANYRSSYGINVNYYFVNWTGPTFEPFFRIYNKRDGNQEGSFIQLKLIYGNLSVLDYNLYGGALENNRWHTFGGGINYGHKFMLGKRFTLEPLMGVRLLTPPYYRYKEGVDEYYYDYIGEGIGWYLTTGLPFDFQCKLGIQL